GEGSDRRREHWFMTQAEKDMINAVSTAYHKAGKKVVVILNVCAPMETEPIKPQADAILCAFQPGCEAGNSMADVLTGKVNPSGHMPMTWQVAFGDALADQNFPADYVFDMSKFGRRISDKNSAESAKREVAPELVKLVDYTDYEEGIYMGYRYFDTAGKPVSYPFGYGLSYTTFDYALDQVAINGNEVVATVTIKNTGKVAGREVAQLYVKAPKGTMAKPNKELKAFAKTKSLKPGESQTLTLKFNTMDMASFNEKASAWELAKGEYQFMLGANVSDIKAVSTQKIAKKQMQAVNNAMKPQVKINEIVLK
ncbi:MAG: glycoside hydrolase family 3 C-terminal domain-containing protein, partial [Bacteroidaceae bacterium]|nr:glycoside hydrolase family 3 C-terminal domain-containing protein [Bacteroidaceae bacterium]